MAVSGGADSVALLYLLRRLHPELSLHVVHFNHQLRGEESRRDEAFTRKLAQEMNLPFRVGSAEVAAEAAGSGKSIEMVARECRYRFFAQKAAELKASQLFMGHHGGDQIELFFLRLLRGASSQGLKGMRVVSAFPGIEGAELKVVRPLLECTREEIIDYLKGRGISWVEDSTNREEDFLRNRIRNELIPFLEERCSPSSGRTLLRTMEILAEESDYLAKSITCLKQGELPFESWHLALQRRAIAEALIERGAQPNLEAIDYFIQNPDKAHSCRDELLYRPKGSWHLQELRKSDERWSPEEVRVVLEGLPQELRLPGRKLLRVRLEAAAPEATEWRDRPSGVEFFDRERVGDTLTFRHWRPGDRFQPIGMRGGSRKLQDIFVDLKIPTAERHQLWLAQNAEGVIFWVEGLRIGEACKVTESTSQLLKMTLLPHPSDSD